MGTSHFRSNIEAETGQTVTMAGFSEVSATTLTDGTITITGGSLAGATEVSATTLTDGTISITGGAISGASSTTSATVSGTKVKASSYLQISSTGPWLFGGSVTQNSASIVAAASSLVTTASLKGSIFMNASGGQLWVFTATMTATSLSTN